MNRPLQRAGDDGLSAGDRGETTAGLRDAALLRTMSDALLRASELAVIATGDVEREGDGSGRLAIRRSKTDQEAEGAVAYLTPATMTALDTWLAAAAERETGAASSSSGRYEGPVFRRVTRTGAVSGHAPLTTNAVRAVVRKRGRRGRDRRRLRAQLPGRVGPVPHRARRVHRGRRDRRPLEGPRHGGPLRQGPRRLSASRC